MYIHITLLTYRYLNPSFFLKKEQKDAREELISFKLPYVKLDIADLMYRDLPTGQQINIKGRALEHYRRYYRQLIVSHPEAVPKRYGTLPVPEQADNPKPVAEPVLDAEESEPVSLEVLRNIKQEAADDDQHGLDLQPVSTHQLKGTSFLDIPGLLSLNKIEDYPTGVNLEHTIFVRNQYCLVSVVGTGAPHVAKVYFGNIRTLSVRLFSPTETTMERQYAKRTYAVGREGRNKNSVILKSTVYALLPSADIVELEPGKLICLEGDGAIMSQNNYFSSLFRTLGLSSKDL